MIYTAIMLYLNVVMAIYLPLSGLPGEYSLAIVLGTNSLVLYFEGMFIYENYTAMHQLKGKLYIGYMCSMIVFNFLRDLDLLLDVNFIIVLYYAR